MPEEQDTIGRYMLDVAVEAARLGGGIVAAAHESGKKGKVEHKAEFDLVTEIDRKAEQVIVDCIREAFPDHDILSEEAGRKIGSSEFGWIIDPLDGTNNFVHSVPVFGVSIAALCEGRPMVAVVFDPVRDEMFTALKGKGSFLNHDRLCVSNTAELSESLVATGFPFRSKHRLDRYLEAFRNLFLSCQGMRRMGSAALDLAYCAAGRFDAFFELGLNKWDIAAGWLLVEEAGGRVTGFGTGGDPMESGDILASNSLLHEEIKRVLDKVFAE